MPPVHKRLHINLDTALAPNSHWLTNSRRVKAKTRNAVPAARTCTACSRPDSRKDSRRIPRRPVTCDRPFFPFRVLVRFFVVGRVGLEPTARGLKVRCSAS